MNTENTGVSDMRDKLLTVSVAGYNVEKYIRQNLDSITASAYIDRIEIFVVDDGGTDGTAQIVKEYEKQFPDSIKLVHKENGGYGTTVNWSADHASGRYFKLLDGDDWFDTKGLDEFLGFIEKTDADMYLSEVQRVVDGVEQNSKKKFAEYDRQVLPVEQVSDQLDFGMWAVLFRTEVLKKTLRKLPEHSLYTDVLYHTYPLPAVRTVGFYSGYVYCYRLGRDEQSVSKVSRNKHYLEYQNIIETIKKYFYEVNGTQLCGFIRYRFLAKYKNEIFNLLLLPPSAKVLKEIKEIEKRTKREMPEFWECAGKESKKIRLMRMTGYLAYWPIAKFADNNW